MTGLTRASKIRRIPVPQLERRTTLAISVTDLFTVGIGPSSSHTVGPMRAALRFLHEYPQAQEENISVELRGSLASTGRGHGTDRATILGLAGYTPTTCPADVAPRLGDNVPVVGTISGPRGEIDYQLNFNPVALPGHPNGMVFSTRSGITAEYYSVGGGFIVSGAELSGDTTADETAASNHDIPMPFTTGAELVAHCKKADCTVAEVMAANEAAMHRAEGGIGEVHSHLDTVWKVMQECVTHGLHTTGTLPGGLAVQRRAPAIYEALSSTHPRLRGSGFDAMEWVNLFAMAVNEENAAGGTVVTAPTNGAAGIIPAVLHYADKFLSPLRQDNIYAFFLTAGAIGSLIKENASISGAEVGCQGEVGSASAMAAAGLAGLMGATAMQVDNAAEIALEHNLGLTCDPVGGLVQIPCIERNAIGAVKAINAARLAMLGDGSHLVRLDDAIITMARTGRDMSHKYKETAAGGLAITLGMPVSFPEC